ncbi:MAG: transglycosylase SLT domain-containing protein [Bilophila sp.]
MNKPLARHVVSVTGTLFLLVLVAGFVPDVRVLEVRRPMSEGTWAKGLQPVTRPLSHLAWNMRGDLGTSKPVASAPSVKRQALLEVKGGTVMLRTEGGASPVTLDADGISLSPLFPAQTPPYAGKPSARLAQYDTTPEVGGQLEGNGSTPFSVALTPVRQLGEPLDFQGLPLRWNASQQTCELSPDARERIEKILTELREVAGLSASLRRRAERYRPAVEKYAARYHLAPELVYALIYTESSFDPDLVSHRSAHGLMQVVPETAGGEVHKWFGRSGVPDAEALLHPETNIKYGTAYLYLLQTRHLNDIDDPKSREYCAIAAYNIGAGGMLKTFGGTHEAAFEVINALSPDEVRERLLKKLPSRETRGFLNKVLVLQERFSVMS